MWWWWKRPWQMMTGALERPLPFPVQNHTIYSSVHIIISELNLISNSEYPEFSFWKRLTLPEFWCASAQQRSERSVPRRFYHLWKERREKPKYLDRWNISSFVEICSSISSAMQSAWEIIHVHSLWQTFVNFFIAKAKLLHVQSARWSIEKWQWSFRQERFLLETPLNAEWKRWQISENRPMSSKNSCMFHSAWEIDNCSLTLSNFRQFIIQIFLHLHVQSARLSITEWLKFTPREKISFLDEKFLSLWRLRWLKEMPNF